MASKTAAVPPLQSGIGPTFRSSTSIQESMGWMHTIKSFVHRVFDRHARFIRQASDINGDFRVLYPEDFRIEAIW